MGTFRDLYGTHLSLIPDVGDPAFGSYRDSVLGAARTMPLRTLAQVINDAPRGAMSRYAEHWWRFRGDSFAAAWVAAAVSVFEVEPEAVSDAAQQVPGGADVVNILDALLPNRAA